MTLPRFRPVPAILVAAVLAVTCDREAETPAPGRAPAAEEDPGDALGREVDPRLVLFDLQTMLESARSAEGEYPTVGEFTLSETWRLQRDVIDAAFSEWSYRSDGATYELSAVRGGKRFAISGPEPSPADS